MSWDSVERHKRLVLSWVLFLQDKEIYDTEAVTELNKYCSATLYTMKKKLTTQKENTTYQSIYQRGYIKTLDEQYTEWRNGLKI